MSHKFEVAQFIYTDGSEEYEVRSVTQFEGIPVTAPLGRFRTYEDAVDYLTPLVAEARERVRRQKAHCRIVYTITV